MSPKGFFESQRIYQLNEKILASAGSSWSDWQAFNPGWFNSARAEEFQDRALEVLEHEFGASRLFVLKDPRICRLMPFWTAVLQKANITPSVLYIHRNPLEVAASLQKRDGIDPGYAHLLWLRHVLDSEFDSRGQMRYFTSYSQLMQDWPLVTGQAQKKLGLSWPRFSSKIGLEINEFLSGELKHFTESNDRVKHDPMLSGWLRDSLEILESWTSNGEDPKDLANLDTIRAEFNATGPAFGTLLQKAWETEAKAKARTQDLAITHQKLAETEAGLAAQVEALAELEARLAREAATAAQALSAVETHAAIDAQTRAQELEALRQVLTETKAGLEAATILRTDLELRLSHDAATAAKGMAEAQAEVEARSAELIVSRAELRRTKETLSQLDLERQDLLAQLAAMTRIRNELLAQLAAMTRIRNELLNSRSWRFMAPMRWLSTRRG